MESINMGCPVCDFIKSNKAKKVYEDNDVVAVLNPTPVTLGEVLVIPKKHFTIIEQVPDELTAKLFLVANRVSEALFEGLGLQGTNILLNNGVSAGQKLSHLLIHVIPRRQDDGLNFSWKPKKLNEEQMATIELKIKEFTKDLVINNERKSKPTELGGKEIITEKKPTGSYARDEKKSRDEKEGQEVKKEEELEQGTEQKKEQINKEENKNQKGYKEKVKEGNYLIRHLRRMP